MRIDSSNIGMESERSYSATTTRVTKMTITNSRQKLEDGTDSLFGNLLGTGEEETSMSREEMLDAGKEESPEDFLSKTIEEMRAKINAFRMGKIENMDAEKTGRELKEIKKQCLDYLMELLFPDKKGKNLFDFEEEGFSGQSTKDAVLSLAGANVRTFTYSNQYYYEETETTTFSTQGTVKCADGREINFNLNLNMSRSFKEYYEENYEMVEVSMCDPLVINLNGNIADLSDQTFFFDIDADGEKDKISRLAEGSGYLALDKNGDGTINDGRELFGTTSGDGFADLAGYDEDGNGFIDEGDEIFYKLKIWTMDENGKEKLVPLAAAGVGAIGLQNVSTDFALTNEANERKGMIRKTGFFLYENGTAGSIQHVDVTRYNQAG
ncbi:MAG: hypothetical protein J6J79_11165 [Lachnospiraceae bacterium]|nr:hypothetical protein [Lachnospiraceae bacterium]